jgi:hypothetical protein
MNRTQTQELLAAPWVADDAHSVVEIYLVIVTIGLALISTGLILGAVQ